MSIDKPQLNWTPLPQPLPALVEFERQYYAWPIERLVSMAVNSFDMGRLHSYESMLATTQNGLTLENLMPAGLKTIFTNDGYLNMELIDGITAYFNSSANHKDIESLWSQLCSQLDCAMFALLWQIALTGETISVTRFMELLTGHYCLDILLNKSDVVDKPQTNDLCIIFDDRGRFSHICTVIELGKQTIVVTKNGGASGALLIPVVLSTLERVIEKYHYNDETQARVAFRRFRAG